MSRINWWHVLTLAIFLSGLPFLLFVIYVASILVAEVGILLGTFFYLILH